MVASTEVIKTVEWTVLTKARDNSVSLRSTVPASIISAMGLKAGDEIGWSITAKGEGVLGVELEFKKKETQK